MRNLVIIDLETTGLNSKDGLVLEVGAIALDQNTMVSARYEKVVYWSQYLLDAYIEEGARAIHDKSGLYQKVIAAPHTDHIEAIDKQLAAFIQQNKHSPDEKILLVNNNAHFDREWIKAHMPITDALLHYRMIDVSSLNEVVKIIDSKVATEISKKKKYTHTAIADCEETLTEYVGYMNIIRNGLNALPERAEVKINEVSTQPFPRFRNNPHDDLTNAAIKAMDKTINKIVDPTDPSTW